MKQPKDPHAANKQRIYVDPVEWDLFKKSCALRGKSPSEILRKDVRARVRRDAVLLRKAKVAIPESLFAK